MFACSFDEHVAGATRCNRLDENLVARILRSPAALDDEGSLAGASVVQIPTDDYLNRVCKPDHRCDALCGLNLTDSITAQCKRRHRTLRERVVRRRKRH